MAEVKIIPPHAYPQLVAKSEAARILKALRSPAAIKRGLAAIEHAVKDLREAVRHDVRALERAFGDHDATSEQAHEIFGLAETAGLPAAGRIADGLCRYFDELDKLAATPDEAVIALHVSAIVRAAYAENDSGRMNDVVADELALLVAHKLQELRKR